MGLTPCPRAPRLGGDTKCAGLPRAPATAGGLRSFWRGPRCEGGLSWGRAFRRAGPCRSSSQRRAWGACLSFAPEFVAHDVLFQGEIAGWRRDVGLRVAAESVAGNGRVLIWC